jgi:pyridoxamine 5'-phosphate oxidase
MIIFKNLSKEPPYFRYVEFYECAKKNNQNFIDKIVISSFNKKLCEVNSRLVNLKYIINDEWTFFSNYNSAKAQDFNSHDQVSGLIYWDAIDVQIRLKANIFITNDDLSNLHFKNRDRKKNALSISSSQSKIASSYDEVLKNYESTLQKGLLNDRPSYWGGFSFVPYYFEFWQGHSSRVNKREVYSKESANWKNYKLQP